MFLKSGWEFFYRHQGRRQYTYVFMYLYPRLVVGCSSVVVVSDLAGVISQAHIIDIAAIKSDFEAVQNQFPLRSDQANLVLDALHAVVELQVGLTIFFR